MKAVMFRGPQAPITVEQIPDPTPGEGQVVIKVGRCGICGSDVHLTQEHGFYPENAALGHEFSGEIVEVGKGVENFRKGDIIAAMPATGCGVCLPCRTSGVFSCEQGVAGNTGAFAEYANVHARSAIKLPSTLTLADGAMVEPLAVGMHGVRLAGLAPGARVLVLGAGAIGLAVIHFARLLGAGRIVAASRSTKRADIADRMGADAFVQTGEGELERVIRALGGLPDVVFETIGVVGALSQAIGLVRPDGTVISLGFCTKPDSVVPALATFRQVRLIFSMAYTLGDFQFVADSLDRGHVEPRAMLGPSAITLDEVPETIMRLRSSSGNEVKIQADPWLRR